MQHKQNGYYCIVPYYTEALWDLTGVTTGTWSEQHHDVQTSRRKENSYRLRNLSISLTFTIRLKFR